MVEWALKLEGDLAVRPVGGSAQHASLLFYLHPLSSAHKELPGYQMTSPSFPRYRVAP